MDHKKIDLNMFATSDAFDDVSQSLDELEERKEFSDYLNSAYKGKRLEYVAVQALLSIAAVLEDMEMTLENIMERLDR